MRVKRLEIQGFKSFKDKTVVHFDHTITGIVGPNGCGKSNIVDAFFWVMGEQSYKHMRGNSSDDLIFNGSSKYSPLGMAEATLVMETDVPDLENGPAGASAQDVPVQLKTKEISVTRRLYRSGEGEYFVNGVPARLKDIHELFMDTGVGAKGYSVIEQGQIGKIVNAKPEERRILIEEAAGIAKYKARKKESIRKMEAAEANLARLNDVIQEIERSLNSLDRQAQKARQYKKYKDELFDKEITWGRRKAKVLGAQMEVLKQKRDLLEQELVSFRAELTTVENRLETDRVVQLTETKRAEDMQAQIQNLASELTSEKSALELSRRRQGDLEQQLTALTQEKTQLEESVELERVNLEETTTEQLALEEKFIEVRQIVESLDAQVRVLRGEVDSARRQMDQSQRELMNDLQKTSEMSSRLAGLQSRIETGSEQLSQLDSDVQEINARQGQVISEAEEARERSESVQGELSTQESARLEYLEQSRGMDQQVRSAESRKADAQRVAVQMRSKLQSLEELAAAYEGLSDGPKAFMEWVKKNGKNTQFEILSDLIEVSGGYETALEGWLEKGLEGFLTSDPAVAYQALQDLRAKKQGRVAVQWVGAPVTERALPAAFGVFAELRKSGFVVRGELKEFVQLKESSRGSKFSELARGLMSGAIVVESLDSAPAWLESHTDALGALAGYTLVSLDGDILDDRGLLKGGKSQGASSAETVLKRKRAIADLSAQVIEAEDAFRIAEETWQTLLEEQAELRAQLEQTQAQVQQLKIQAAGAERDVQQTQRALKEVETQATRLMADQQKFRSDVERAENEKSQIEASLMGMGTRKTELEALMAQAEAQLRERESELRNQEERLQSVRIEETALKGNIDGVRREVEGIRRLIADRERRQDEIIRTLDRARQEREQHTGGDSGLEQRISELTHDLGEKQQSLSWMKDQLEQCSVRINQSLERIKELHQTGDRKSAESNQLAVDAEKLNGEMNYLLQNLEEKYGPGCLQQSTVAEQTEMEAPVITAAISEEEEKVLAEEVERLRERIRRLGEVNVGAIEEFEEVKQRHEKLLSEKSDLDRSIQDLKEAIEHINKTSEERFRRAFQAIAERFERLFPIIFGGGQAKLSLVYPEGSTDILEAGIDILAQPPGKKVANISLLSGGEKALTAVSLIFAIFMVKPSPFCILDEVDAPLDDANVGKFNALLREMSVKSQFILITHNKKTMELNDTLYGVTMEEPGVSKVISIEMH